MMSKEKKKWDSGFSNHLTWSFFFHIQQHLHVFFIEKHLYPSRQALKKGTTRGLLLYVK